MSIYKETKDREMNIKEQELSMYKEILQEKEQRLDDIQRATETDEIYTNQKEHLVRWVVLNACIVCLHAIHGQNNDYLVVFVFA